MNSRIVAIIGLVLALWMSLGRWLFGIGGALSWWYVPAIGLTYALLQFWVARRLRITRVRGRRTSRSTVVALVLSWVCAIGFGFTVPDAPGGELVSILGLLTGSSFSGEMSIALCNPLGIVAFSLACVSLGFALADGRDPKPEEDEDDIDRAAGGGMVPHPLA